MDRKFMIHIFEVGEVGQPISGESLGATRMLIHAETFSEDELVQIVHTQLHDGIDWVKRQLDEAAVRRLLFGKQEEAKTCN